MHEMSRHTIHVSEILSVTIETMEEMQRHQMAIRGSLPADLGKTYQEQAKEYMSFQLQLLKSLKLRSDSNQERLKNEVNLVIKCFLDLQLMSLPVIEAYNYRCSTLSPCRITQS